MNPARRRNATPRALETATALLLGMAAAVLAATPAFGWGRLGHRAAADVAEARLSPAAKAAVKDLLLPGETLADASTWADEVRRDRPESSTWHYINVPITEPGYDPRFGDPKGHVVGKINDLVRELADTSQPKEGRREALRYLVHFVQDMHQPVHVGDRRDRGGNDLQLRFFEDGSNLHRIWDSGLIDRAKLDEPALAQVLIGLATPAEVDAWTRGTVEDWANESHAAAKAAYRRGEGPELLRPGDKLGQAYVDAHLPVAERRLAQAGVRLADVLNKIFD